MSPCANEGQFVPWAEFPDSSFAATCADAVIKFPALEDTKGCDDYTDVVPGELLSFYEVQSFVAAACCAGEVPVCKPNVLETPCKDPDAFDPYKEFWVTDMPFPFSCSEQVFAPGSNFDQVMDCGDPGFDDVARWFSDGCCEGGYKASVCYGFGAPDYKDTMTDFVGLYKTVIPCKDPFDFDIYKYLDEYTQCGQIVGFLPALTDWEFGLVGAMCCKKPPELCAAGSDFLYDGGDPTWPPGVTCEMVAADLQGIFDPEYAKESDEYAKEVCGMTMDTDGTTYAAWAVGLAYFCCEGRKSHCDEIIPQACSDKDAFLPDVEIAEANGMPCSVYSAYLPAVFGDGDLEKACTEMVVGEDGPYRASWALTPSCCADGRTICADFELSGDSVCPAFDPTIRVVMDEEDDWEDSPTCEQLAMFLPAMPEGDMDEWCLKKMDDTEHGFCNFDIGCHHGYYLNLNAESLGGECVACPEDAAHGHDGP